MSKTVSIIGSGFSGISAATHLANKGVEVNVFEKNSSVGGRARQFAEQGFTFDMGPSWYWMPEVIEQYFNQFGKSTKDYFELKKLDPGFKMIFGENDEMHIPDSYEELRNLFESIESGAANQLDKFIKEAQYKYDVGINRLVHLPGNSILELIRQDVLSGIFKLQLFSSFSSHIRKFFKNPKLLALLEFPVLFLGASPEKTPALYSLMNYAGLKLGTFYPMGGFGELVKAMKLLAEENGVTFYTNSSVDGINVIEKRSQSISVNGNEINANGVIGAADYNFIEQKLLSQEFRNYDSKYWDSRTFAPSCLLFYIGIDRKVDNLIHHNLFFDESLEKHSTEIYDTKQWPTKPLFYVCCPSKTDDSVAPQGKENLFLLMPIATGIKDSEEIREQYFEQLISRLEKYCGHSIQNQIIFKRSYCITDFKKDYNAFGGNAYGLANTLFQTANFKPKLRNKKVKNLFYSGQLTVPGPGVPPSIISGKLAANEMLNYLNRL